MSDPKSPTPVRSGPLPEKSVAYAIASLIGTSLWMLYVAWPHVGFNYGPFVPVSVVVAGILGAATKVRPIAVGTAFVAGPIALAPWTAAQDADGLNLVFHMLFALPGIGVLLSLVAAGTRRAGWNLPNIVPRQKWWGSLALAVILGVAVAVISIKWPRPFPSIEEAFRKVSIPGFSEVSFLRVGQTLRTDSELPGVSGEFETDLPIGRSCALMREGLLRAGVGDLRALPTPGSSRDDCSLVGSMDGGPFGALYVTSSRVDADYGVLRYSLTLRATAGLPK